MRPNKFKEFSPVDKQAWVDQAVRDLKGGDFEQTLVTDTVEGFSLSPFYTAEDAEAFRWVKAYDNRIHPVSSNSHITPRVWTNAVWISGGKEKDMNREILFSLNMGADGLILELTGREDLGMVFRKVLPEAVEIWIKPLEKPGTALKSFFDWASDQSISMLDIKGGLLWDGLVKGFEHRIALDKQLEEAFLLNKLSMPYPNFKSICLDTSVYHNAGASSVQELGYGMAAYVELMHGLTGRGAKPGDIIKDTFLCTAVGSNFFMEIAKIKTLRIGFHQLAELYQVSLNPEEIFIFSKSSGWSKSRMEPDNNMPRNTSEAMAAIIGGCNTLFIEPHDYLEKPPNDFSKRMARNISLILKEECYFDKVLDPAAGSYYVENLVHALHTHAFRLLRTVENNGGWWKSYSAHDIQEDIRKTRREKIDQMAPGSFPGTDQPSKPHAGNTASPTNHQVQEEAYQLKRFFHPYIPEKTL